MSNKYYNKLVRSITSTVILVSIAPLIFTALVSGYFFHTAYKSRTIAYLKELVKEHKRTIDSFLWEKVADINVVSKSYTFETLNNEESLQELLKILQEEHKGVFVDLGFVNDKGIQSAYAGPFKLKQASYADAEWFTEAMKSKFYISDVFLGLRGLPHFIVAVKKEWEGKQWILRSTIDFVYFNKLVENIQIGKTGLAFIVNKKGAFQTKPRTGVKINNSNYLDLINNDTSKSLEAPPNNSDFYFLQKADEDNVIVVISEDQDNNRFINVITTLKYGDWILIYRQDIADAFENLYRARNFAVSIFIIGSLSIIFMAFIISRRVVGRIERIDQEKNMMNQQVIETGKLASIGELAAGIAHEINNPVAIMVEEAGWIEDLLTEEEFKDGANLEEFKRALKQINTQGKRCKEITYKLLSFARKTDSRIQEIQINDLIKEIVELSGQRAKYSNINVIMDLADNMPFVRLSPSEMQQVLLNIINNAFDAMEKTGGKFEIKTYTDDNYVAIDLSDNGPGIPEANLSRIFDPFFTTKPVGKGTGLGLSICYGIINKIGGKLDVKSIIGKGTTFTIKIPVEKEINKTQI
ncbi:MAG: two-component sensor histidine kinase [Desulfobacterales bacterium]|nr:two-component sensor histidine kinase [Desulfobacterales bacterium]